jgi:hypothetical protein
VRVHRAPQPHHEDFRRFFEAAHLAIIRYLPLAKRFFEKVSAQRNDIASSK